MEQHQRVREAVEQIVKNGGDAGDRAVIQDAHPADLAQALQDLPVPDLVGIFRLLSAEQAGGVLTELGDEILVQLLQALDEAEVSALLNQMPAEDAADIVKELPAEEAEKILDLLEEEHSEDVQELLEYPEQSAGRLMSPEVVAVAESATVEDAIQHIRKSVGEERPFELYVVDDHGHLVGVVPLRRLLIADPRTRILAIRDEEVISVPPTMDREEVARVVAKYDLVSVAVVDAQHRLIGTISVDDVLDVVGEEASEDIFRIAGSDAAELERRSPRQLALLRLPWILTTLGIEMVAALVIAYFDRTLAQVILLAAFIPVIQATSGNTGLQSVTMVVRGLATGHVQIDRWWEPLRRQIQTSSIIGAVCAVVVGSIGLVWHSPIFGLVVGAAMFVSVNLAGAAGAAIPMASQRLGFDPALTAGPFQTALLDVLGVTIFLSLATGLLRWLT
jgi:magnesium transporter